MTDPTAPRQFALLVGIDLYLSGNSRIRPDGTPLSINNLKGCVNDVKGISQFLENEYVGRFQITTLTSPANEHDPAKPDKSLPTFANIEREFNAMYNQARAGDMFFFHYSGHGGRLEKTPESPPNNKLGDPSLLTMDFCRGERAIRGWELNKWLKRLNDKKVQVVVLLDSCYSGGSWRDDECIRNPKGWTTPPNLPSDECTTDECTTEPDLRNADLEVSWSINPEGFTLMAACASDERAAETNGKPRGVFTDALLQYFEQNKPADVPVTYRTLRDRLASRVTGQTPGVYGRDRLLFFGSTEPFSATPLIAQVKGEKISLPVGKLHGVCRGSEFKFSAGVSNPVSVDQVSDVTCSAPVSPDCLQTLQQTLQGHTGVVIPSRWSFGDKAFQVASDPALGTVFQGALFEALQDRIASPIEVLEDDGAGANDSDVLRVAKQGDGIEIVGPNWLIGYGGPVRGLSLRADNGQKIAVALAHMGRFGQILGLRNEASGNEGEFELSLEEVNDEASEYPERRKFRFVFDNKDEDELYVTVMNLGPGFHIRQLFPPQDRPQKVPGGRKKSFLFFITIPDELKGTKTTGGGIGHRDIIRTLVTKGEGLSWKTLELPAIWNADQVELRKQDPLYRDADVAPEFRWWVEDREVLTLSA